MLTKLDLHVHIYNMYISYFIKSPPIKLTGLLYQVTKVFTWHIAGVIKV